MPPGAMASEVRESLPSPPGGWASVHIPFVGGIYGPGCDTVIREVVRPVLERCRAQGTIERAFFVRYREGGPHVRLRLQPARSSRPGIHDVVRDVRDACARRGIADAVEVAYEPEVERYGGLAALPLAEAVFHASSELAFALVTPAVSGDRPARLGRALLATLVALHVFAGSREAVRAHAGRYARSYLNLLRAGDEQHAQLARSVEARCGTGSNSLRALVHDAWECLIAGEPLSPDFDAYRHALVRYRDAIEALLPRGAVTARGAVAERWDVVGASIGPSLIHMTNNRLGISIPEEVLVTAVLERALDEQR